MNSRECRPAANLQLRPLPNPGNDAQEVKKTSGNPTTSHRNTPVLRLLGARGSELQLRRGWCELLPFVAECAVWGLLTRTNGHCPPSQSHFSASRIHSIMRNHFTFFLRTLKTAPVAQRHQERIVLPRLLLNNRRRFGAVRSPRGRGQRPSALPCHVVLRVRVRLTVAALVAAANRLTLPRPAVLALGLVVCHFSAEGKVLKAAGKDREGGVP